MRFCARRYHLNQTFEKGKRGTTNVPKQEAPQKLGRYKVVRELGKGAMGVVYEGLDPNIGRRVAIKTARRDVMEATGLADEMMARFLREAQAAGGLNHPNIITIFDAGEEGDIAYIAMEYLEGGDLQDLIKANKRFDVDKVVDICATVADALGHAHRTGTVHRDVKPANIMMPKNAPLKIADFGIAHVSDSSLTQTGAMIGTPHYMSPEQFMGQHVDGRTDLFSLGIILYEMLTGEKPFTGDSLSAVMHKVLRSEPIAPRELNFAVNEYLDAVVMKALSKEPDKRYQTGEAMAAALRESLKPNPDPAVLALAPKNAEAATVVAPSADDATVVAQPDADATVAAAQPAEATVAAQPQVEGRAAAEVPLRSGEKALSIERRKKMAYIVVPVALALIIVSAVLVGILARSSPGASGDSPDPEKYFASFNYMIFLEPEDAEFPEDCRLTIEDPDGSASHTVEVKKVSGVVELADCGPFVDLKPTGLKGKVEATGFQGGTASSSPPKKAQDRGDLNLTLRKE